MRCEWCNDEVDIPYGAARQSKVFCSRVHKAIYGKFTYQMTGAMKNTLAHIAEYGEADKTGTLEILIENSLVKPSGLSYLLTNRGKRIWEKANA